jgi:hypothetical protein
VPEPVATGAKLTITRAGQSPAPTPVAVEAEKVVAEATPEPVVHAVTTSEPVSKPAEMPAPVVNDAPKAEAPEPAKPRIVIIRRKPEEIPELPAALAAPAA